MLTFERESDEKITVLRGMITIGRFTRVLGQWSLTLYITVDRKEFDQLWHFDCKNTPYRKADIIFVTLELGELKSFEIRDIEMLKETPQGNCQIILTWGTVVVQDHLLAIMELLEDKDNG